MAGTNGNIRANETFVASNGTNLSSFTGWTSIGVTAITVLDNRLISNGASGGAPAAYVRSSSTPGSTTYAVAMGVHIVSTSVPSISCWLSLSGSNNAYAFQWSPGAGAWVILRIDSAVPTTLASGGSASAGNTYDVVLERAGSTFRLWVDDVLVASATDSTYSNLANTILLSAADVDESQGGHITYFEMGDFVPNPPSSSVASNNPSQTTSTSASFEALMPHIVAEASFAVASPAVYLHTSETSDVNSSQVDVGSAGFVLSERVATVSDESPLQSDVSSSSHDSPIITGSLQDVFVPQVDAATSTNEAPVFLGIGVDQSPAALDTASSSHLTASFDGSVDSSSAVMVDAATSTHTTPVHTSSTSSDNVPLEDVSTSTLTEPAFTGSGSSGNATQSDASLAGFNTYHPASGVDTNTPQEDSATVSFSTPVFEGSSGSFNVVQEDSSGVSFTSPVFEAVVDSSNPAQVDGSSAGVDYPPFTAGGTSVSSAQVDNGSASNTYPSFAADVSDQAQAFEDTSSGGTTTYFIGSGQDTFPIQLDVASTSFSSPVFSGGSVSDVLPQSDEASAQHTIPAVTALGGSEASSQVDAGSAVHHTPVFESTAESDSSPQADSVSASHSTILAGDGVFIQGSYSVPEPATADPEVSQALQGSYEVFAPAEPDVLFTAAVQSDNAPQADSDQAVSQIPPGVLCIITDTGPSQVDQGQASYTLPDYEAAGLDVAVPQFDVATASLVPPVFTASAESSNSPSQDVSFIGYASYIEVTSGASFEALFGVYTTPLIRIESLGVLSRIASPSIESLVRVSDQHTPNYEVLRLVASTDTPTYSSLSASSTSRLVGYEAFGVDRAYVIPSFESGYQGSFLVQIDVPREHILLLKAKTKRFNPAKSVIMKIQFNLPSGSEAFEFNYSDKLSAPDTLVGADLIAVQRLVGGAWTSLSSLDGFYVSTYQVEDKAVQFVLTMDPGFTATDVDYRFVLRVNVSTSEVLSNVADIELV